MRRLALAGLLIAATSGCRPDPSPSVGPEPAAVAVADPSAPPGDSGRETPPEPAPLRPNVAALEAAAYAAATSAGLAPAKTLSVGPIVGARQPGRTRIASRWDAASLPGKPRLVDFSRLYVSRTPQPRLSPDGKVVVRWWTEQATPPASLFVGMRLEDDPLVPARYRAQVIESQRRPTKKHEIEADLRRFIETRYDVNRIAERGYGEVAWRLEGYDAARGSTVLFDGRTAFRLDGDRFVQQPTVVLGPLVHQVSETGFIVSFETDVPTTAAVGVGTSLPVLDRTPSVRHEVAVSGLAPGRRHVVQVAISDGAESSVAPPRQVRTRSASGPIVVALMSDSRSGPGPGNASFQGVNAATLHPLVLGAYRHGAEAIFFPGDLVDGYSTHPEEFDWQLRAWLHVVEPVHGTIPIYTGMGNHEALTDLWSGEDWVQLDRDGELSAEARFAAAMVNPGGAPPPRTRRRPDL